MRIAYTVCGSGEPYVFMPFSFCHVQLGWQHPALGPWLTELATHFRLVHFDPRGTGMSSRGLRSDHVMSDLRLDLETVADHLQLDRFILHGVAGFGTHPAVEYAVRHPERLKALILSTPPMRQESFRAPVLWHMLPTQDWETFLQSALPPNLDLETRTRIVSLTPHSYEQEDFVLLVSALARSDIEGDLRRLQTPTLVLHPRESWSLRAEESERVAQLAHARMALIEGTFSYGDVETGIRAIEAFLSELAPQPDPAAKQGLPGGLSEREAEVLRLIAAGRSNQEIADELVISLHTVRRHLSNLFDKTGVHNRTQAAGFARDRGLL
jgi:DNA-binding CsgD family transcriptional regulator